MFTIFREFIQVLTVSLALSFPASQEVGSTDVIRLNEHGDAVFSAQISEQSYEKLLVLYKKKPFNRLIISSPGGDFDYGIKMAEFVYKNRIFIYVPNQCNSACTIPFFSARKNMRDMSDTAILGLHNISIETNSINPDKTYVSVTEMRKYTYEIADKVGYLFTLYSANKIPPIVLLEVSTRRGSRAVGVTRENLITWGALNP